MTNAAELAPSALSRTGHRYCMPGDTNLLVPTVSSSSSCSFPLPESTALVEPTEPKGGKIPNMEFVYLHTLILAIRQHLYDLPLANKLGFLINLQTMKHESRLLILIMRTL
jgi:hypothetical protein